MTIHVAAAPAVVRGDADRLAQVVANLVDNALKHAASRVDLAVGPQGERVRVVVDDDGPGIDPADLPHVFERLYVARRRPRRQEAGSGLGLAIRARAGAGHGRPGRRHRGPRGRRPPLVRPPAR